MGKDEDVTFSPREMEVLALAWQCFDVEPKIDYDKLAVLTGYTKGSASVTMGKIKRKLKLASGNAKPMTSTTPATTPRKPAATPKMPKSTGKRTAAAANDDDESPTKKSKSAKKKTVREEDDEEEFRDVRIKNEETTGLLQGADEYFKATETFGGDYEGYLGFEDDGNGI